MTPFYANYGYHPKTIWPNNQESKSPASKIYGHWLKSIHQKAAKNLEETKVRMNKYLDKGKQPTSQHNSRDWVILNTQIIHTKRLIKKLVLKFYGPFQV